MKLIWYGHSAFRIEVNGATILIDPFFTGNPGFKGSVADATAGVTHIVLTHGHGDHVGDTLAIAAETGVPVIANYDLCMWLAARGLKNFDPMNTGGTTQQDGFAVTLVRAEHSSAHLSEDGVSHSLGSAGGVVITAPGEKTLYHMGDTDIFGDMALINEIWQPKIGIVPIGDRFTMGGKVAAIACKRFFNFETIIPSHYASFPIVDQSADAFLDAMGVEKWKVAVVDFGVPLDL